MSDLSIGSFLFHAIVGSLIKDAFISINMEEMPVYKNIGVKN